MFVHQNNEKEMATVILGKLSTTLSPSQLISNSTSFCFPFTRSVSFKTNHLFIKASSSSTVTDVYSYVSIYIELYGDITQPKWKNILKTGLKQQDANIMEPVVDEKIVDIRANILACPICYKSLGWNGDTGLSVSSAAGSSLQCNTCRKTYFGNETHLDLRVATGGEGYGESRAASTELFRFPLISFLYERGWRQSFGMWGGFPGPEKEFELMKEYLQPVFGGNIIDASCGSGMFSRIFTKSGLFSLVVALDYSETMLQQCYEFIKQEENFPEGNLVLVRADIARLPFSSSTVDAIHAGAALHCWPSPSAAVAEISRILRPGGMFVATTYILDGPFQFIPLLGPLRQNVAQVSGSRIFLSERELEDLCTSCGLEDFKCTRNGRFVMIAARKPV